MQLLTWDCPLSLWECEVKWSEVKVTLLCLTFCDPMNYTVHGILQARILEWVAFPFSRGSSQPRDWTQVSRIAGGFFTSWTTKKAPLRVYYHLNKSSLCFLALPVISKFFLQGDRNLPSDNISGGASQETSVKPQLLTSFVLEWHWLNSCFSLSLLCFLTVCGIFGPIATNWMEP